MIQTLDEEFAVKIKFFVKKIDTQLKPKILNLSDTSLFDFFVDNLPVYLYSFIGNTSNSVFNLKLLENENNNYNFSNLEIKGYMTNKESIDTFANNYTLKYSKQLNQISIEEKQLMLINTFPINSAEIQYDYLFIEIKEISEKQKEKKELHFQLYSNNQNQNNSIAASLKQKKYIYDKITLSIDNKHHYLLNLGSRKLNKGKKTNG